MTQNNTRVIPGNHVNFKPNNVKSIDGNTVLGWLIKRTNETESITPILGSFYIHGIKQADKITSLETFNTSMESFETIDDEFNPDEVDAVYDAIKKVTEDL